jgi:hypothetical protein
MAGLATMHFSAITVGVLAILGGWIVAAGTAPDPRDWDLEGRDDVREGVLDTGAEQSQGDNDSDGDHAQNDGVLGHRLA